LILFNGWFISEGKSFQFGTEHLRNPDNLEVLTVFFTVFVLFQFWNIFNSRALRWDENPFALLHKNPSFLVILALIAVVQVGMVHFSGTAAEQTAIGEIFRTQALSLPQWIQLILVTITIIPAAWGIRYIVHLLGLYDEK
jgi:Ca2+-transporting ATPase